MSLITKNKRVFSAHDLMSFSKNRFATYMNMASREDYIPPEHNLINDAISLRSDARDSR